MVEAGFVPAYHHPTESVEFCERLRVPRQMLGLIINKTATKKSRNKRAESRRTSLKGADTNSGSSNTNAKTSKARKTTQKRCCSFVESNRANGYSNHINTTINRSNECKVLMAQAASMRGQAAAAFDWSNKKNENPKKSSGDFHVLTAQADSVSKSLQK